jgi:outer membrane protein
MFKYFRTLMLSSCLVTAIAAPGQEKGFWQHFGDPYSVPEVPSNRLEDTSRLKMLIRGAEIYLSLEDAIALAVENNLDVAVLRYTPVLAAADLLRTRSGAAIRGVQFTVREAPAGVGGPASLVLSGGNDTTNNQSELNLALGQITGIGTGVTSPGPSVPNFDPAIVGLLSAGHSSSPEVNTNAFGMSSLTTGSRTFNAGFQQGFASGALFSISFNNTRQNFNATRFDLNPSLTSSLGLTVIQPLLQGFGWSVNRRFIRIAANDQKIADLAFRQQLIATVSGVIRLYWDLVGVRQDTEVKQQALRRAEVLLENNRAQVEVGTLAPIEVSRAQSEVARTRQGVTNSESLVLQQEVILKNFLSRRGTEDPDIRSARIIPTDTIQIPDREATESLEALVDEALRSRPDYAQARVQIDNARITLEGSRSLLKPQLDLVGSMQNNALAGDVTLSSASLASVRAADAAAFTGSGYGSIISQLLRRHYPDYSVYLQLTIPLSNRQAKGDMMRDKAQVNQSEMRVEQLKHQVRTEVESALIAVQRARAAYEAARQTRTLQEEALEAEQEKYSVGATTSFFVIQYQRDLAQARSDEVIAMSQYAKARTALERATGRTLASHNIDFGEAYAGELKRVSTPVK